MTEPRRVDLEVSGAELDWPDVDRVIAFAEGALLELAPGVWQLADVARFATSGVVTWTLGFVEGDRT